MDANNGFEELHGWTRDEVIGKVFPISQEDDKEKSIQLYQRIIQGEQFIGQEVLKTHRNGSCFYANVTISQIKDEQGIAIAFVCVEKDITDRKKIENELVAGKRENRRILKLSPLPIVLLRDGIITFVNDKGIKLLNGQSITDFAGRSIYDFFTPACHPIISERMRKVVQTDDYQDFIEMKLLRLDGKILDVEVSSIYINKHVGDPLIQLVIHDLTERKMDEEMIRRSEKLSVIGELAAGVAHEIRNPITSIKGFMQLLKAKNIEYADIIIAEIERINVIVNEFMAIAKPHDMNITECDLQELVDNVVNFMQPQALLYNVQTKVYKNSKAPAIHCDPSQIKQVVMNILKNAIESMPQGGIVDISVVAKNEGSIIRVVDQGCGIPEDKLSKVSEPFFSMKEGGTGLGLIVCQRIIEAHNGKMSIQSELNKGTVVEIELPSQIDKVE